MLQRLNVFNCHLASYTITKLDPKHLIIYVRFSVFLLYANPISTI